MIHLHCVRNPSVHSGRLERWLGNDQVQRISDAMSGGKVATRWYGPPIGVSLVPGKVYATSDGDFVGKLVCGSMMSLAELTIERFVRRFRRWFRKYLGRLSTTLCTFSSLGDMASEASNGKLIPFVFQKVGPTGVVGVTSSLYRVGNVPVAGTGPGNAPGGTAFVDSDTGGFPFVNPGSPDTQHFVSGFPAASVAGNTLLLYDLIYGCNKTMNSTANEAVTGVPTRYQGTNGAVDGAQGNFLFIQVGGTQLAATAHNWGVAGGSNECLYRDPDGNDNQVMPVLTGNSGGIVDRLDHPTMQWFAPLAAGDTGIKDLAQMRCSALVATGVVWFMIGHPLAWMPVPIANLTCPTDAIRSAFQLTRIFDDAFMAFLEVNKPATTATTYNGYFNTLYG